MGEVINVGLIGYGLGGRCFHAPVITSVPGLKLSKIYTTKAENLQHIRETYKDTLVVSNVDHILDDPDIKLVIVATPSPLHFETAKLALEKGKHVIVEKPFTATINEADTLIALAKRNNCLITVNQNRRWDSDFKTVEKIVKGRLLGDIVNYEAHFDRYNPAFKCNWKEKNIACAGVLYDLGSHLIDQALCLFGLPEEVFGDLKIQKQGGEAIDYFKLILKYSSLTVTLRAGSLVREVGPRYTLHGTKGSFVKYGLDVQEAALKLGLIPKDIQDWGKEPEELWGKINTEIDGLHIIGKIESETGDYRAFYRNVYEAVLDKTELQVMPEQARNTIRIIELSEQSNKEKRWVKFQ